MTNEPFSLRELAALGPFGVDKTRLDALLEAVDAAKSYLDADDEDPDLGAKFSRFLEAQERFTE